MIQSKTIFYEVENKTDITLNDINTRAFLEAVRDNDTDLPDYKLLDEELDLISLAFLDGQYSNRFNILEITKPLDLVFNRSNENYEGTFENLGGYMYEFDNWQITNRKHCRIDMKYSVFNINHREAL